MHIEVSRRCNARCWVCFDPPRTDGPLLEWGLFEQALGFVGPGAHVELFGRGEPLMHPRFADMAQAVAIRGGRIGTVTNGTLLTRRLVTSLPQEAMDYVAVSIHGAEAATHERLQPGVRSDVVWRNVRACADAGVPVMIATVVLVANMGELEPLAAKARAHGADSVTWLRLQHGHTPATEGEDPFSPPREAQNLAALREVRQRIEDMGVQVHGQLGYDGL